MQRSMKLKLVEMAMCEEEGLALETASEEDTTLAIKDGGVATTDFQASTRLRKSAKSLEAESDTLMEKGETDRAKGEELMGQSNEEESESEAVKTRSSEESIRGKELQSSVVVERTNAASLETKSAEEIAEADADTAEAATDEAAFEAEAELVAESTIQQAALEAEAVENIEAVGACEALPFFDVVCDVVGGATEIGSQVAAHLKSIKVTKDFVLASAAKAEETIEFAASAVLYGQSQADTGGSVDLYGKATKDASKAQRLEVVSKVDQTLATQLKAKAIEDAQAAADFEALATEEESEAKKKQENAIVDKTKAAEKDTLAEAEKSKQTTENIKAQTEQATADNSFKNAIKHGVGAFHDAVAVLVISVTTICFFVSQSVTRYVLYPIFTAAVRQIAAVQTSPSANASTTRIMMTSLFIAATPVMYTKRSIFNHNHHFLLLSQQRDRRIETKCGKHVEVARRMSYAILHVIFLVGAIVYIGREKWQTFVGLPTRSRGGLILYLACITALTQVFFMHAAPHIYCYFCDANNHNNSDNNHGDNTLKELKGHDFKMESNSEQLHISTKQMANMSIEKGNVKNSAKNTSNYDFSKCPRRSYLSRNVYVMGLVYLSFKAFMFLTILVVIESLILIIVLGESTPTIITTVVPLWFIIVITVEGICAHYYAFFGFYHEEDQNQIMLLLSEMIMLLRHDAGENDDDDKQHKENVITMLLQYYNGGKEYENKKDGKEYKEGEEGKQQKDDDYFSDEITADVQYYLSIQEDRRVDTTTTPADAATFADETTGLFIPSSSHKTTLKTIKKEKKKKENKLLSMPISRNGISISNSIVSNSKKETNGNNCDIDFDVEEAIITEEPSNDSTGNNDNETKPLLSSSSNLLVDLKDLSTTLNIKNTNSNRPSLSILLQVICQNELTSFANDLQFPFEVLMISIAASLVISSVSIGNTLLAKGFHFKS